MPRPRIYPGYCEKCGGSWLDKGKLMECETCGNTKPKMGR